MMTTPDATVQPLGRHIANEPINNLVAVTTILRDTLSVKPDTHYPYTRAVNMARIYGCHFGHPYIRAIYTGVILDTRI